MNLLLLVDSYRRTIIAGLKIVSLALVLVARGERDFYVPEAKYRITLRESTQ